MTCRRQRLANILCYEDLIEAGDDHLRGRHWMSGLRACCASRRARRVCRRACCIHIAARCCPRFHRWRQWLGAVGQRHGARHSGFFHCNGWAVPFLAPMYGAKLVLPGRRADERMVASPDRGRGVTIAAAVPTIWLGLLEHCRATGQGLGALRRIFSGGTAPPAAMIASLPARSWCPRQPWLGDDRDNAWATISFAQHGLSDDAAVATMRTQGKPLYGNDIRNVDDGDKPLPRDGKRPDTCNVVAIGLLGPIFNGPSSICVPRTAGCEPAISR